LFSYYGYPKSHYFLNHLPALIVQEFDTIYNKDIIKRYERHELKRLSNRKGRKRDIGAVGRPFKLDLEN
jgi:hypothetical protein